MNTKGSFEKIKQKTLKDMDRLLASLEKHMAQKTVAGDDNW